MTTTSGDARFGRSQHLFRQSAPNHRGKTPADLWKQQWVVVTFVWTACGRARGWKHVCCSLRRSSQAADRCHTSIGVRSTQAVRESPPFPSLAAAVEPVHRPAVGGLKVDERPPPRRDGRSPFLRSGSNRAEGFQEPSSGTALLLSTQALTCQDREWLWLESPDSHPAGTLTEARSRRRAFSIYHCIYPPNG